MIFKPDLPAAARRHLEAATVLRNRSHFSVAGYLYGIAAECAIKAMMVEAGMQTIGTSRPNDPYYAHFPELRTLLRDGRQMRRSPILLRYINNDAFMNNWSIRMRYSAGKDIKGEWVEAWAKQAQDVVSAIGT
jgi:hypothetical protein